jgi:integrase/recombinase XerD
MADATPAVRPLGRRMIDDMTLRNLSPATQRSLSCSPKIGQ